MGSKGITFVELLVVLLLLAVLTGLAVPLVQDLGSWPLRTAAHEIANAMQEARLTAITHGLSCTMVFYDLNGCYRLDLPHGTQWVDLPAEITMIANLPTVNNRPTLYFRYTGAPNQGGYIRLQDSAGRRLYIIVTPVTGRVRIDSSPP
ncbi:MAG: hypothetical protein GX893_04600 [Firmicutes bacterium]|nr:hypothetical protein [Bacillota bacterium]